jgi:hypothetical protein
MFDLQPHQNITITVDDMLASGYCAKGSFYWSRHHGISRDEWRDFVRNGWPAQKLMARGDALADRLVREALARRGLL